MTFFREETRSCVKIPELNTYVYGMSYHRQEIREALYDNWKPEDEPGFHVLLAHGGDENHIPIDVKRLSAAGFTWGISISPRPCFGEEPYIRALWSPLTGMIWEGTDILREDTTREKCG